MNAAAVWPLNDSEWLPVVFLALMGISMLAYVVLDGFDLGVGMLFHHASASERDQMVASIGPFWDANETWLVLGVGLLLIAFPKAHGVVLTALYLPVTAMLIGLILRGVAFDFRVKARTHHQAWWNTAFFAGSTLAAVSQGWMLGRYVTGFAEGLHAIAFATVIAACLPAAYVLLGACWLILKTEDDLQRKALRWAAMAWWPFVVGMALISMATPWISPSVRVRWFSMPGFIALLPIPVVTMLALLAVRRVLHSPLVLGRWCWMPFMLVVCVFVLGAIGLAYSLFPYVVMDRITIWEAASAPESLKFILVGVVVVLPAIMAYTVFAYRVFKGKAAALTYG